jgi:hypothetical protein
MGGRSQLISYLFLKETKKTVYGLRLVPKMTEIGTSASLLKNTCRVRVYDDDPSFIVLTETKFSLQKQSFLLLQDLVQSCLHGGGEYGRTCATRDDEPRPVW